MVGAVVGLRLPAVIQPTMLFSCVASAAMQDAVEVPTAEVMLRLAIGRESTTRFPRRHCSLRILDVMPGWLNLQDWLN